MDEALTPDSSRFWPADQYRPGGAQPSFDKQFVRDWLIESGWNKEPPAPTLPSEVVEGTLERYGEAYRLLTGADIDLGESRELNPSPRTGGASMSTTFTTDSIRNVAVTGHSDTGKTSLVSALLLNGGAVNRLLKVDDGNTVTDFDEDEHERKITINTAIAHFEHRDTKVNLIDTPGYSIYTTDAMQGLRVADAACC